MRDMYFFERGGSDFEAELANLLSEYCKRKWGVKSFRVSTLKEDQLKGTDFYVLGMPMDVTLAYETKRKMRRFDARLSFDGIEINFGIRFGNGRFVFDDPVLVIGVDSAYGIRKSNAYAVLDSIKTNIEEILETGMDLYFEEMEKLEAAA